MGGVGAGFVVGRAGAGFVVGRAGAGRPAGGSAGSGGLASGSGAGGARPRVAFYGDDFTGSVDVLLQFARRGWSARLFVGRPTPRDLADAAATNDVVGIAGVARSLPTDQIEAEVGPALDLLLSVDPDIVQYKACSTADSSPTVGSLGRVLEVSRSRFSGVVPMLFAQPDFGRYTAFGHHFAAERGTVYRLDRQPTMSQHPSTPMHESDLAEHLRQQTSLPIASLPFTQYPVPELRSWPRFADPHLEGTPQNGVISEVTDHAGAAQGADPELRTWPQTADPDPGGAPQNGANSEEPGHALAALIRASDAAGVVLDALDESHLLAVGAAVSALPRPVFAIGSGGLSHAIAAADPRDAAPIPARGSETGPVLVVSGSRSAATRRQADHAACAGWLVRPLSLTGGPLDDVIAALASGRSVVLTSDDADTSGAADVLPRIAAASADAIRAALPHTRRIIVAGGDTSSRVTSLLGVASLSIAANPCANVVLLKTHATDPQIDGIELLLKGGQVGDDDLFEALRTL
ncbi:hypothetical protein GCM10010922_12920 [Microbacterium sorbitolivorans]|uniref:Four-carbon acid sugar kinase family protein n=1 Tax=Microbacterium sorbitolivorans TaxID=1867410 RepID=A0A367XXD9_9MICO|nr:four-carbon acid sugar kinase family protein [Microbacterium sorbitolivorans]GGF38979.1 hypothetical protein GCM10010922_12920 [Microbacterium sorbitolivorans]